MSIVNTRNAVIGWAVVQGGKYAVKQKARESAPAAKRGGWVAGALAAAAFVALKARKRGRSEPE
jgi:hypothetical protein